MKTPIKLIIIQILLEKSISYICNPPLSPTCKISRTALNVISSSPKDVKQVFDPKLKQPKTFFPRRPEDALSIDYNNLVEGAYIRHILTRTKDVANLAIETYWSILKGEEIEDTIHNAKSKLDPFGHCATLFSICKETRDEGGKVGWVDNPHNFSEKKDENDELKDLILIPKEALAELFLKKPKGGDIYTIESNKGFHIFIVDDIFTTLSTQAKRQTKKLKGTGKPSSTHFDSLRSQTSEDEKKPQYYQITTLGCQMNVADSERLESVLQSSDLQPVTDKDQSPNLVLINTCSIRDHAEQKLYDLLGPLAKRKQNGDAVSIIVAGCVAQQESHDLISRFPEVDIVMGPQYVNRLPELLHQVEQGSQVVATDPTLLMEDDWSRPPIRGSDLRAWVNVIYGCNEHCTYCVVPGTRGVEQSRSMEHILQEILSLDKSYKEVTLLGQNIDAYGRDMTPKRNFAQLLNYLNDYLIKDEDNEIQRIRYVTSHPRYFTNNVIDAIANCELVCESFLLPFQSGDDQVLKNMRRGYTFDSYMKFIDKIKEKAPDASICGDVIVGFPGETEAAFQRTLDLMSEVKFDNLNSYTYSPRPNTEAAFWEDQIPLQVKKERLQILQDLARKHALERSQRYLGRVVEVLVEDVNPKLPQTQVMGRNRQNRLVFFDGVLDLLRGKLVNVKITEARPYSLSGTFVSIKT